MCIRDRFKVYLSKKLEFFSKMSYCRGLAYLSGTSKQEWFSHRIVLPQMCIRDSLKMDELGFVRSTPAETGTPGYDPRDLLKLYIYGYFYQRCV